VAAVVALLVTPLTARLSQRIGAVDRPRDRGLHDRPMPYLGGLAILAAVLVATALFVPVDSEIRGILLGGSIIAGIGAIDDAIDLHPALKLAGQVAAAPGTRNIGVSSRSSFGNSLRQNGLSTTPRLIAAPRRSTTRTTSAL